MLQGLTAGIAAGPARAAPAGMSSIPDRRPPPARRRVSSLAVERTINAVRPTIADPVLATLFVNCFPNTLDTAVTPGMRHGRPDCFVVTGDIDALWLRDSANQLSPYLPLAAGDPVLRTLFRGLIGRHARCVLIDPYANAFLRDPADTTPLLWARADVTTMVPGVAERKWELDSLCSVAAFAADYWHATGDATPFDDEWRAAMGLLVTTLRTQQRLHDDGPYRFLRPSPIATETLPGNGLGNPTRRIGLIHSGFRPSDDACIYPFLVPANLFAASALRRLARLLRGPGREPALAGDCVRLADTLSEVLQRNALVHLGSGAVWAYEIDGFGNALLMDDANIPSLSALPLFAGADADDALYRRTRARLWSEANPWFFRGPAGEGIGGPHEGLGMIWPMSQIVRGLTARSDREILECLAWLKRGQAGTGLIHESFDRTDAGHYTRPWFAWANGLFGTLILNLHRTRPHLLAMILP